MGVYSNVDKSIDMERRFDRAKIASDTVRGSFTQTIGYYDSALHEQGTEVTSIIGFRNKDILILEDEFRSFSDKLIVTTDDGS